MRIFRLRDRTRFTDTASFKRVVTNRMNRVIVATTMSAMLSSFATATEPAGKGSVNSWANLLSGETSDPIATDPIGLFDIEPVVIPTVALFPQDDVLEEAKRALENSRRGDVDSLSDRLDRELDAALRDILDDRPGMKDDAAETSETDDDAKSEGEASRSKDESDADESASDGSDNLDLEDRPQPKRAAGRFDLPRLTASRTTLSGEVPKGLNDAAVTPLAESGVERSGDWAWTTRTWAAANTFSHPLYFEDRMLERHGHERWGYAQPLVSGVRFYSSLALLPYLSAIEHPCDCRYTLGYYRSGTCTPRFFQRPPWDRKAIVQQSAATAAGMAIVP